MSGARVWFVGGALDSDYGHSPDFSVAEVGCFSEGSGPYQCIDGSVYERSEETGEWLMVGVWK